MSLFYIIFFLPTSLFSFTQLLKASWNQTLFGSRCTLELQSFSDLRSGCARYSICSRHLKDLLKKNSAEFRMKVRITKSEISTRTWCSLMSAASQGAFVLIPEISHSDISMHNKKIISLYKENGQRKSASVFRYAYLSVFFIPVFPFIRHI